VHIVQFFVALLFAPNVHVVVASLPDPVVGVMMNRGGQLVFRHENVPDDPEA